LIDEIKKKINLKKRKKHKSELILTFETGDPSYKYEVNPIEDKPQKLSKQN
jgi:hypothetical protein